MEGRAAMPAESQLHSGRASGSHLSMICYFM